MARCVLALGPDHAGDLLAELLDRARRTLDVAVYEAGPSYAARLARAAARGVDVRLLLDAHAGANSTSIGVLRSSRASCRVVGGHAGSEGHWKLLLADGAAVAVGTGNLLRRDAPPAGAPGTREWWVRVDGAPALAEAARRAFEDGWDGASPPPAAWRRAAVARAVPPVGVPRPAIAPLMLDVPERRLHLATGGAAVATALRRRLRAARRRLLVLVPYVHTHVAVVRGLLDLLAAATRAGADVRLLLGAPPEDRDATALAAARLRVKVMDPLRSTTGHAKGVVVDGVAIVASANWSGAGLGGNLESSLTLVDGDAADWFAAAHERDWEAALPLGGISRVAG